jgi:haloalkane dehalogenase
MGDSAAAPDGNHRFFDHQRYLNTWFDAVGVTKNVILVVHDWGSALGFSWAQRHPDKVKAIVYMECIVRPFRSWDEWPDNTKEFFQRKRTAEGEEMILEKNLARSRDLPIAGEPADVVEVVESCAKWMSKNSIPKLFIDAEPAGSLGRLTRRPAAASRSAVPVAGTTQASTTKPWRSPSALHRDRRAWPRAPSIRLTLSRLDAFFE